MAVQVDARGLRATLELMADGALEAIKSMLLRLAKDLCMERLEVRLNGREYGPMAAWWVAGRGL